MKISLSSIRTLSMLKVSGKSDDFEKVSIVGRSPLIEAHHTRLINALEEGPL